MHIVEIKFISNCKVDTSYTIIKEIVISNEINVTKNRNLYNNISDNITIDIISLFTMVNA